MYSYTRENRDCINVYKETEITSRFIEIAAVHRFVELDALMEMFWRTRYSAVSLFLSNWEKFGACPIRTPWTCTGTLLCVGDLRRIEGDGLVAEGLPSHLDCVLDGEQ